MLLTSYNLTDIVNYINQLELRMQQYEVGQQEILADLQELANISTNSSIALIRADRALSEINNATLDSLAKQGKKLQDVIQRIKDALPESELPIVPVVPEVDDFPYTNTTGDMALIHEYYVPYTATTNVNRHSLINADGSYAHFYTMLQPFDGDQPVEEVSTILRERDVNGMIQTDKGYNNYEQEIKLAFEENVALIDSYTAFNFPVIAGKIFKDQVEFSDFVQGMVKTPILKITTATRVTDKHNMYEKHFANHPLSLIVNEQPASFEPKNVYWADVNSGEKIFIKEGVI